MRRAFTLVLLCALSVAACLTLNAQTNGKSATPKETFGGNWTGTFDGDGSGSLEMTLTAAADEKHTGKLKVTMGDGQSYTVDFKTVTFDGKKMTAKYDSPGDDHGEIVMEGTFEGDAVTGTWQVREPGGGGTRASGNWKAGRKS